MATQNQAPHRKSQPDAPAAAGFPAPKKTPDWESIQLAYRVGTPSIRAVAAEHGITEGAIRKRAKAEDWTRDLSAAVKSKRDDLVRKAEVRSQVRKDAKNAGAYSEREKVEISATIQANVILAHRTDIGRSRRIVMTLLSELEAICGTENAALLAELGDMMRSPDDHGQDKFNDLYQKLVSLPGRAKTMKDLGDSLRVMVALEREAFSMDTPEDAPGKAREMSDAELAVRLFAVFGEKQK